MKLPSSSEMQALDHSASKKYGIPSIVLMENAGLGTVRMMTELLGPCRDTFVLIFIGPGNNGGDGLVIGRHLHQRGCVPVFFFLTDPGKLRGDSAVNLNIVSQLGFPLHTVDSNASLELVRAVKKELTGDGLRCYAMVDAIFGIGLSRDLENHFAAVVDLINDTSFRGDVPVFSVDIPSGMDADTGRLLGTCVRADFTATYGCAKPGHFIHGGAPGVGRLQVIDIGIPPEAVSSSGISTELITRQSFRRMSALLCRKKNSHKGNHGHLLILAGSAGKTGAAMLAAKGALRSGTGLVSLAVPGDLNPIFETSLAEAMTIPLPSSRGCLSFADADLILNAISTRQAVVIGPGIGQNPETAALVLEIYHKVSCPVLFDADALNLLAANKSQLKPAAGARIFTPHPGELGRLLDIQAGIIQADRIEAVVTGCRLLANGKHAAVLLLKGAGTVVTDCRGAVYINSTGNPGMATGGMGDVLSGVIGGLLCQGFAPLEATLAGAYLHGAAADDLFSETGAGYTATELADRIPRTLVKIKESD